MEHLIIKGIGPDRPGIVSEISKYVTSNNGNIEESRMIRLGSEFSILMLISISSDSKKILLEHLESMKVSNFTLHQRASYLLMNTQTMTISFEGADNEGIVHR